MNITVLVMQRKQAYDGQFLPEVLGVVDEVALEENPQWWVDEIAKQKASIGDDADAWAEVTFEVPTEALDAALYPAHKVDATIAGSARL